MHLVRPLLCLAALVLFAGLVSSCDDDSPLSTCPDDVRAGARCNWARGLRCTVVGPLCETTGSRDSATYECVDGRVTVGVVGDAFCEDGPRDTSGPSDLDATDVIEPVPCRETADCDTGVCVAPGERQCAPCSEFDTCTDDSDCTVAGELCGGARSPDDCGCQVCSAACETDEACRTGESCEASHCVPSDCGSDIDCPTGFACDETALVCVQTTCVSDAHCEPNAVCVKGLCYASAGTCQGTLD